MHHSCRRLFAVVVFGVISMLALGCQEDSTPETVDLEREFPTEANPGETYPNCLFTSPLVYESGGEEWIVVARAAGIIEGLDAETGEADWSVELPEPDQGVAYLLATPALVDDKLIVAYHAIEEDYGNYRDPNDRRLAHLVAVVDLQTKAVDEDYPVVELQAEVDAYEPGRTVEFLPGQALTRSTVNYAAGAGSELGRVYLGQGNTRDIQPWHGWAWEIDLDVWRQDGADEAITGVLNTTPEPVEDCGEHGTSGSRERKCGGGLWAPSGHLVVDEGDDYHLILAPGNGRLDLQRQAYANTLMKVEPGLDFDPKCDEEACADFDSDAPSTACMESCENLFIPRLMPDQQLQRSPDGRCDGLDTLFECWGEMDYIGGSTPVRMELEDHNVLVYPTKDGHAYLVDADHLGRMYDRHRMVEMCGDHGGDCTRTWAGMSVTKPLKTRIDGEPAVLIPNFMSDQTNEAGLVALKVVESDGEPRLERAWEFPDFGHPEAIEWFRYHPSRVMMGEDGEYAWIVDVHRGDRGLLTGVRVEDGTPVYQTRMDGAGRRFVKPLIHDDRVYVPSCNSNTGPGQLEAYRISE